VVGLGRQGRQPASLRKASWSGYPPYGRYVDPARFWGEKLDLPEIYETYSDVLGNDHAHVQAAYLSRKKPGEHRAVVEDLFASLCTAHPALPSELATTESAMRHVVYGCVTKLCAQDIRFFLTKPPAGSDLSWRKRKVLVEQLAGGWHFEWCPSDETLDRIEVRMISLGPGHRLFPRSLHAAA
jgi:hypothetical protein